MARMVRRTHAEMSAEAIDTAYAIVAEEGIAALTIRRLAEAIGCSVGTIYNLFVDFDDLEQHLAARAMAELGEHLFAAPLPEAPHARVRLMAARYVDFAFTRPRLWSMLFDYRALSNRPPPDWHEDATAALTGAIVARTRDVFTGEAEDVRDSIETLWASVHGIATLGLSGALGLVAAARAPALADRLVGTFLAGSADLPQRARGRASVSRP